MDLDVLISYKGISYKIALLILGSAFGIIKGIGTDRHLYRVFNAIGWSNKATTPEESMWHVLSWLPRKIWPDVNDTFAGLCQLMKTKDNRDVIFNEAKQLYPEIVPTLRAIHKVNKTRD